MLVLFRYYFILCAFIIYILYTLLYIERKRASRRLRSWVVGDEFRRWAPRRLRSWVVGDESRRWASRRLRSWVVGDEFRRWAPRRLHSWVRSHIPADPDRRSQPEPSQCGGAVILENLSPRDRNSKCNALNINYFISPFRLCRATRNCRRGGNYARKTIYNHLKHK